MAYGDIDAGMTEAEKQHLAELEATCEKQSGHISKLGKQIADMEAKCVSLECEARGQAQEARTQSGIVRDCLKAVGAGSLGDWHGAEPVRNRIEQLKKRAEKLRDYAGHTPGCPGTNWQRHPERGCLCGWAQTEATLGEGGGG